MLLSASILALCGMTAAAQLADRRLYHAEHGRWSIDCTQDAHSDSATCYLAAGIAPREGDRRRLVVVTLGPWETDREEIAVYPDPPGSAGEVALRIDENPSRSVRCARDCVFRGGPARGLAEEMLAGKVLHIRLTEDRGGASSTAELNLGGFIAAWRDWRAASARMRARSAT